MNSQARGSVQKHLPIARARQAQTVIDKAPKAMPLLTGRLVQRYKRFFADVIPDDSSTSTPIVLHCPNTGAMTGLLSSNARVKYQLVPPHLQAKRKTRGTLLAIEVNVGGRHHWVGVNTLEANRIARNWLEQCSQQVRFNIQTITPEVPLRRLIEQLDLQQLDPAQFSTRVDFVVTQSTTRLLLVEVKSVTLYDQVQDCGYFPDATSTRAHRQLQQLMALRKQGLGVMLLYVSQHPAIQTIHAAAHIDVRYAELVQQAKACGVIVESLL